MKEGWEYKTLGEVGLFISGYTPKKNELNSSSGTPYFKVSDMNRLENQITLTYSDLYIKTPKKIFPKGSIVFPKNGGAIYTEKKRFLSQDSVIDLNSEAIFADENYIIKEYLFYFLSSIKISSFDNGGGLPSININRMKECSVPLPNIDEQRRIVSYLDSSFKLIDEIKNKALKSLTEAKALFQSALAEAMELKEGWEEKTLGECCDKINGLWKGKKPPFIYVGVIRNANFTKKMTLDFSNIEYLDVEVKQYNSRKLKRGDLIIEKSGGSEKQPVGRAVLFLKGDGEYSFSNFTSVLRIKNNEELNYYFLYYFLLYIYQRGDTKTMQKATTGIHNIEFEKYLNIKIPIMSLNEQRRIVSYLDKLSSKVRAIEEKYQKMVEECDALKQAMLRDVFE